MKHPVVQLHEGFLQNVIRILSFYNGLAIKHLQAKTNQNEHIHQTRLCFKRIRSLLRLGRPGLGEDTYRSLNAFYRDNARLLSQARDITAVIEAISPLIQNRRSESTKSFLISLQRTWMSERKKKTASEDIILIKTRVAAQLMAVQSVLDTGEIPVVIPDATSAELSYPVVDRAGGPAISDNRLFVKGMVRIYRQGKRLYRRCRHDADDHLLHEWRKRVKYTWYQLVMLQPLWPGMIKAWSKEWQTLSVWLGDHNDLVLITSALDSGNMDRGRKKELRNLKESINRVKRQLLIKSLNLGKKLYAEKASEIENKLMVCLPR